MGKLIATNPICVLFRARHFLCGLHFLKLPVTCLRERVKGLKLKTSLIGSRNVTNGLTYIDIVKRYISDTTSGGLPLHSASEYPQVSVRVGAKGVEYFRCVLIKI